ncbi:hypothetical protein BH24PSE2_BH24PSE2_20340 [soil metagenome]
MTSLLEAYLNTPAGCDGGNINGRNWLFAIEYGGEAQLADYDDLVVDPAHGCVPDEEVATFISAWPFNQRIAKFEAVKHRRPIKDYLEFAVEEHMFTANSQYYKGNVGGLGFRFDDQASFEAVGMKLGIAKKSDLKVLEINVRERMFQRWVTDSRPSSVCCFGTSDAARFIRAFSDRPEQPHCWNALEGFRYYSDIILDGDTAFFVLPHPTARFGNGMTSDSRIEAFGNMVRTTMLEAGVEIG